MKKLFLLMSLLFVVTLGAKAQMLNAEDLEKYCIAYLKLPEKPKDKDWVAAAQRLKDAEEVSIDKITAWHGVRLFQLMVSLRRSSTLFSIIGTP